MDSNAVCGCQVCSENAYCIMMSKQVEEHQIFSFSSGLHKTNVFAYLDPWKWRYFCVFWTITKFLGLTKKSLGSSRVSQQLKKALQNTTSFSKIPKFCLNPMLKLPLLSTCSALRDVSKHSSRTGSTSFPPQKGQETKDWLYQIVNASLGTGKKNIVFGVPWGFPTS